MCAVLCYFKLQLFPLLILWLIMREMTAGTRPVLRLLRLSTNINVIGLFITSAEWPQSAKCPWARHRPSLNTLNPLEAQWGGEKNAPITTSLSFLPLVYRSPLTGMRSCSLNLEWFSFHRWDDFPSSQWKIKAVQSSLLPPSSPCVITTLHPIRWEQGWKDYFRNVSFWIWVSIHQAWALNELSLYFLSLLSSKRYAPIHGLSLAKDLKKSFSFLLIG